jgi:hypothetical protein
MIADDNFEAGYQPIGERLEQVSELVEAGPCGI